MGYFVCENTTLNLIHPTQPKLRGGRVNIKGANTFISYFLTFLVF